MDSQDLARMYAQIVNGVSKEQSRYVTDEESGALWDQISGEVEEARKANPNVQFEIPNEVPLTEGGDGPVMREDSGEAETPAEDAAEPAEEPTEEPADGTTPPEEKPAGDTPAEDKPADGAKPEEKPEEEA